MKRIALLGLAALLIAPSLMATYIVVLKDGTRYRGKQKWTIVGGKALVALENGQTLQIDPSQIDVAKSEQLSKSALGDVTIIDAQPGASTSAPRTQSLGERTRLRKVPANPSTETSATKTPAPVTVATSPAGVGNLGNDVLSKFSAAYENVGIFEKTVTSTARNTVHVELTADSEDKVFKAISASAYMMLNVPKATGSKIDMVELFMSTTNGGAAGRFLMTPADAALVLDSKAIPDYFIRKVVY